MGERVERKIRSDKKRDVKPLIPLHLKKNIYRLSDVCDLPVKDIASIICVEGLRSKMVMEYLLPNFKRGVRLANTVYFGSLENHSLQRKTDTSQHERITIKFVAADYENIGLLAYALDVTPSRATAILINAGIRDPTFIHTLLRVYSRRERLSDEHKDELKRIMKYINSGNPFEQSVNWSDIAIYVGDFIINGWRKIDQ